MGLKRKEKKKLGDLHTKSSGGSSGSSRETSPFRPLHVEKKPPCTNACPSGNQIREILTVISQSKDAERPYEESYKEAYRLFMETSPLLSVCGRVCPHPCENGCNRQYKDGSVAINNIERFIGDYAIENNLPIPGVSEEKQSEKVAVIGSGPAGLSCAYQLAKLGYQVDIYEAFSKSGGMLRYGIPDYRLPSDILDAEIGRILSLGININYNTVVGKDIEYSKLQEDYDAIFVGIGAHRGKLLGIPNEDAPNVWTGTEFLNKVNAGTKVEIGEKVLVIGGGDTAIDAARISRRLGAEVTLVYRRTRNEMPAIEEEIVGAEEEGITFHFLAAPIEFNKEGDKVISMKCQQMELGEPDDSGRRRPVPIADAYFDIECTTVVSAISQEPSFDGMENLREGRDWVKADEHGVTKEEKTFAGGDVLDLGLVTVAIGQGRGAAETIHRQFRGLSLPAPDNRPLVEQDQIVMSYYAEKARHEAEHLPPSERLLELEKEITCTLSEEEVKDEASRCMSCGQCFDCGTCWSICQDSVIKKPYVKFQPYTFKMDACKGCSKCAESCPCGYIEMKNPMTGEFQELNRMK